MSQLEGTLAMQLVSIQCLRELMVESTDWYDLIAMPQNSLCSIVSWISPKAPAG
jgi:hypothetical protein